MYIFKKLFERGDVGIDLGAANMRGWVGGKGLVMEEPSAVALAVSREEVEVLGDDPRGQQESKSRGERYKYRILAVGAEAGKMIGKTPGSLVVLRAGEGTRL